MNWANLIISILGAALNLFLLSEPRHSPGLKFMFALAAVVLILRAIRFGYRIASAKASTK